ncbi:uroporphyrinogen decarboxylase family protein, partial [Serratia sp. IR-2025]
PWGGGLGRGVGPPPGGVAGGFLPPPTAPPARGGAADKVALQGNMDPSMLYASPARIAEEVETILAGFGHGNGHVFNLGHGIHQDVPPEHAGAFVEAVHAHSAKYHR